MRRAIGVVAVMALGWSGGRAEAQYVPNEANDGVLPPAFEEPEPAEEEGLAGEEPAPTGVDRLKPLDEDEDEEDVPRSVPPAPRAVTVAPTVTPRSEAPVKPLAPAAPIANVQTVKTAPAPRNPPAAPTTEAEFDPYSESMIRGYFGTGGLGTFLLHQVPGKELLNSGGGLTVFTGVDLGPWLAIEVAYTGSFHTPGAGCAGTFDPGLCSSNYVMFDLLSLDLKLHLPTGTPLVPFLQAGAALAWLSQSTQSNASTGAGFEGGGGIEGWANKYVTITARVLYRGMQVNDVAPAAVARSQYLSMVTTSLDLGVHF